eukprot:scaffold2963_cov250-Pinguiococcus_pyrenoidosus.AAC.38
MEMEMETEMEAEAGEGEGASSQASPEMLEPAPSAAAAESSGDPEMDALAAVGGLAGLAEEYDDEPLDVARLLDLSDEEPSSSVPAREEGAEPARNIYSLLSTAETVLPKDGTDAYYDGCCGVILVGDIRAECLVAAGARPVSPVYYCAQSDGNNLKLIRMAKGEDGIGGLDPLAPAVPPLKVRVVLSGSKSLPQGGSLTSAFCFLLTRLGNDETAK